MNIFIGLLAWLVFSLCVIKFALAVKELLDSDEELYCESKKQKLDEMYEPSPLNFLESSSTSFSERR